ncbi:MAG: response regulator [Candidatus Odinarchaeota archaeon]
MNHSKNLILVVEDDPDILYGIKLTLELNNYCVIIAKNGKEALNILFRSEVLPDLIISDILMPEMNGYDFFKQVSAKPELELIPFIFLSARTSPEDVRFGKMLGVDDYITKPFNDEDLLATIAGKIARFKKYSSNKLAIEKQLLSSLKAPSSPTGSREAENRIYLVYVVWDDYFGPELKGLWPKDNQVPFSLEETGFQLFQAMAAVYGQNDIIEPVNLLIKIDNIKRDGYIHFNYVIDEKIRGKQRGFMIGIIAPRIGIFESLKLKEVLETQAQQLKETKNWNPEPFYEEITEILSLIDGKTPGMEYE